MNDVFIICNQQGHFWGKSKTWVDGRDARAVVRVKNRDEASNTLFELSSKDFELRGEILAAELGPKGEPMVAVSDIPLPEVPQETPEEEPQEDGTPAAAEPETAAPE
ncbi:MAG: hypothetical protein V7754_01045 [Halioglobus sp.]